MSEASKHERVNGEDFFGERAPCCDQMELDDWDSSTASDDGEIIKLEYAECLNCGALYKFKYRLDSIWRQPKEQQ